MNRGEVRWCKFSHSDEKRPVLILSRDSVLAYLGEVTIGLITSTVRGIPSEVTLSTSDGMRNNCAVNCDHLLTIATRRLIAVITTLTTEKRAAVSRAIRCALDIERLL